MRFTEKTEGKLSATNDTYKKHLPTYVTFCCCLFPLQMNDFKCTVE